MRAIIIDDQERARRVLKNMLEICSAEIELVGLYSNVPDAVIAINKLSPDVVFCDIEMPDYSGLELLSFFKDVNFEIIFVTGYSEYALQAFEVSAIDYLLKPLQLEKLERAIEKLALRSKNEMPEKLDALRENLSGSEIQKIALPNIDGLEFVDVDDIIFLEADGAYTHVFFSDGNRLTVSKKIKTFEILLQNRRHFFRIHRSYIVNINHLKKYSRAESYVYLVNGKGVKVARDKKAVFEEYIKEIRI